MPNYNGETYIAKAIDSVVSQHFKDWELLVCDDNSSDESIKIIKHHSKNDNRIKLLKNNNKKGPAGARNTGIEAAKGQYIAFLDSDDLWYPQKLEKQISFMQTENLSMSYCWYDQIDKNGRIINDITPKETYKTYKKLLKIPAIGHLTAIYDTSTIGKIYMPDIQQSEDLALWLSVLKKCGRGACLHEKLAAYRLTPNSLSSNKFESAKGVWNVLRKIEKLSIIKALYNFSFYACYGIICKGRDILYR